METRRWRERARRWVVVGAVAAALAGGLVMADPATRAAASPLAGAAGTTISGHSLEELLGGATSGRAPLVVSWPEFRGTMGYTPTTAHLPGDPVVRAIKPTGACSSILGSTSYDFSLPCKAHDLGYDLLRFAARTGHPLGAGARRALDDQLARDLHARCAVAGPGGSRLLCDGLADLYEGGARLNSWRQHYGTP